MKINNLRKLSNLPPDQVRRKRVIVRADLNVKLTEELPKSSDTAVIDDDTRIVAVLPTIQLLQEMGASKIVLMSHMARPGGKVVDGLRMKVVGKRLSELLKCSVITLSDCIGDGVRESIDQAPEGSVILLENLRFDKRETDKDPKIRRPFAQELASLGEIYINDAFGAAHRRHASTADITDYLPSCAGLLMEKELAALSKALNDPAHPFVVIIGGAKVVDKLPLIDSMGGKADIVVVAGRMAWTFMKNEGINIGDSFCDEDSLELIKGLKESLAEKGTILILPKDMVCAPTLEDRAAIPAEVATRLWEKGILEGWSGYDIGEKTKDEICSLVINAKLVVWNGPVGMCENKAFADGTECLAEDIANSSAYSIVGGGDSVAAVKKLRLGHRFDHISTGGGASLEFLEGKELPGVAALYDK